MAEGKAVEKVRLNSARLASHDTAFLRASNFFEKVVETVKDGILVNAPDGTILFMNDNLAGILGYPREELLGGHLFDLMDDEGIRLTKERLARRREGVEESFDFRFIHRDGHSVWTRVSAKPFHDEKGIHRGSLVAISDISERKYAEEELRLLLSQLEQRVAVRTKEIAQYNEQLQREIEERKLAETRALTASQAKSSFLANMSHELRTPLTTIIGFSQLMEEELIAQGHENHLPDLKKIQRAGHHLLQLISDILDISKIEAGKVELDLELIALPAFLDEIQVMADGLCKKNNNEMVLRVLDAPQYLHSDRLKLRQILLNFLGNAAKFTRDGSITLEVMRQVWDDAPHCVFAVRDTGIGIAPNDLVLLFEPFQQVDNRPSRKYQGAGLGLSICREFALLMGGRVWVESELGEGSSFYVALPSELPAG